MSQKSPEPLPVQVQVSPEAENNTFEGFSTENQ